IYARSRCACRPRRNPFDRLAEIVDAAGDPMEVMMDGGVQRGTHVLKALSLGAKDVGVGRFYLFPLAAAGQAGLERALSQFEMTFWAHEDERTENNLQHNSH